MTPQRQDDRTVSQAHALGRLLELAERQGGQLDRLEEIVTGNGNPSDGLVVKVDRLVERSGSIEGMWGEIRSMVSDHGPRIERLEAIEKVRAKRAKRAVGLAWAGLAAAAAGAGASVWDWIKPH